MDFMQTILAEADSRQLKIQWILETHAHADHLTAANELRRQTGARIACGRGICQVQENFSRVFNMQDLVPDGSQFDRLLGEGDVIELGNLNIAVLETPGHTNDSVTYYVGDAAFVGDTLFAPTFGTARCDFPGGDASQLYDSIKKIYALPEDTRLFLCHDYPGKGENPVACFPLSKMKKENIHLNGETRRDEYVRMRTERDAQLGLPKLLLPSLQVNILAGALPAAASNGVNYLKVPFNQDLSALINPGPAGQTGDDS
jgi:glyoxylase-like metal-dependent hydrolase (beta-lactamase superfamily II)